MSRPTRDDVITRWRRYNEEAGVINHLRSGYLDFTYQVLKSYNNVPIACYHPPRFASNKNGYVLILYDTPATPWATLSQHKRMAARAVTFDKFFVPHIGTHGGLRSPEALKEAHELNGKWLVYQLNELADASIKQFRMHDDRGQWGSMSRVIEWVRQQYTAIEHYKATTGAEFDTPLSDVVIRRIIGEREKNWLRWSDPKAVAQRARALARREAIKALNIGD